MKFDYKNFEDLWERNCIGNNCLMQCPYYNICEPNKMSAADVNADRRKERFEHIRKELRKLKLKKLLK